MSDTATSVEAFRVQHSRVLARIADAASRSGREPAAVTLVAVSKTVDADRLRVAVEAGIDVLAENRVQEAEAKIPLVDGACWHLVGSLQSNKARRAVELFDVVESVDSVALARRLDRIAGELRAEPLPVFVQVNVDADTAKAGFDPASLEAALTEMLELEHLQVRGLMTVGRLVGSAEEARPTFRALRSLGERLRSAEPRLGGELSMGMTDDFEVAVEEGATIVRVGRALFGERGHNPHHDH
jgi:pyridoxal phosphate enzyme (YggS family)